MYVVVVVGLATGFAVLGLLRPAEGVHVYEVAVLLAVIVTELPLHIAGLEGVIVITGLVETVTVTVAEPVHPLAVPVTVYVVVDTGLATGLTLVVLLKPVAGDHE